MFSLHVILAISLFTEGLGGHGNNHVHSTSWSIYSDSFSAFSSTPDKSSTSKSPTPTLTTSSQTTTVRSTSSFSTKSETTRESTSSTSTTMGTTTTLNYTTSSSIGTTTTSKEITSTVSSTSSGPNLTYTMTRPFSSADPNSERSISVVNGPALPALRSGVGERLIPRWCLVIVLVSGWGTFY
ncbi:hypothetical protein ACHWQZ_G010227 [Mnemiopsis leidyi]